LSFYYNIAMGELTKKKTSKPKPANDEQKSSELLDEVTAARQITYIMSTGESFLSACKTLGFSVEVGRKALDSLSATTNDKDIQRLIELSKLDNYESSIKHLTQMGDLRAVQVALKIQEGRRAMLGLDQPKAPILSLTTGEGSKVGIVVLPQEDPYMDQPHVKQEQPLPALPPKEKPLAILEVEDEAPIWSKS
jgi:hypothetical protein